LPEFDWHLPLMSLPLALRIFEPLPMGEPYLHADAGLRASWRERLGPSSELRVGLAWKGNPAHKRDRVRSMALTTMAGLLKSPGVRFYSLQAGADQAERESLAAADVIDWTSHLANFAETAALVAELDLIISVDTAVAHLAGALGRPVWTLLPYAADWRWGQEAETTPWYPTMRLFRQHERGDWRSVLRRVEDALDTLRISANS
jgi:hypothetical protein